MTCQPCTAVRGRKAASHFTPASLATRLSVNCTTFTWTFVTCLRVTLAQLETKPHALEEEMYMRPPAGAEGLDGGGSRVLHLKRALYGLRQASCAWNKRLEGELRGKGFVQSDSDPALWILLGDGGTELAMFYSADRLVAARTAAEADALVELGASMFAMRSLGEPQDFWGSRWTGIVLL
jgi:hypothetical protein